MTPEPLLLSALTALVALGMVLFLVRARTNYNRLPQLERLKKGDPLEDVIVIVPARNEETHVGRCIRSFPPGWVLVVDDDSLDRTAELARLAQAEVLPAPPLLKGALGKPNACAAGAKATASEWILFADADTWYDHDFLASLLAYARLEGLDMVSVFPKQEWISLSERIILPYAFALYFCGVDAEAVNAPESMDAMANGQCILFRREVYDFIGGHGAVLGSVIEDAALARNARRHRINMRILRAEKLAHVRMYDGFDAIWRGFTRNSSRFLPVGRGTAWKVILVSILLASWLPIVAALLLAQWWIPLVAFAVLPTFLLRPWYGAWHRAALAPAAIYLFQLIALNALLVATFGRKTTWKGRPV